MAVQTLTTASFDFLHTTQHLDYIMNATDYWPFVREYSIWKTTVATLQFWTADLEPYILSSAIEQVYTMFSYTTSTHQQSEEVFFSCIMTGLNVAFESKFALEDEAYESGSENLNISSPLRQTPRIHYVSSDENISFDHSAPHTIATSQSHHKSVCHQLSFSSSDDDESSTVHIPSNYSTLPPQNPIGFAQEPLPKSIYTIYDDVEEEDFETVALDDEHWITEPVSDRHLCIHEDLQLHSLCPYPFPCSTDFATTSYQDTLDLSAISGFEDVMMTSSDEDIPALEDVFGL